MDKFFSEEELELLNKEIPGFQAMTSVSLDEAKQMLEVIRAPLPGHQIREISGANTRIDCGEELKLLLSKAREKVQGLLQAMHTYSQAEERGFTNWINKQLGKDEDCKTLLPLQFEQHELFSKVCNGIILCKMVNLVQPNTIHPNTISRGDKLKHIWN
ncbi:phospholipid scramblase 1, partial [Cichlidogyrus casuarinus]